MRQSQLFTKALREAPKDAESINAQMLERGGFVHKNSAGVYTYLPLGWRVIQNISRIIREEMDAIGGQELLMPALVEKKYLEATGRWEVNVGYKISEKGKAKSENYVLGWTHEEVLTSIAAHFVHSYKDLPFAAYQIQNKFRNEARAKSGVLRGREFLMKDLYSFHASQEDFEAYYLKVKGAYEKIFSRCGLNALYTVAGGGAFTGNTTHEFQVVSPVGEDTIFTCAKCRYSINSELSNTGKPDFPALCPACSIPLEQKTAIEVGNIFPLGTKYSDAFNLGFLDEKGERKPVVMGSYGIGVSRLMGTIVELFHDEKGMVWPESIAPFRVHLLDLTGPTSPRLGGASRGNRAYVMLQKHGVDVLYDDRQVSAGEKFAVADLLGIPYRAVVSEKTGGQIEVKRRNEDATSLMDMDLLLKKIESRK